MNVPAGKVSVTEEHIARWFDRRSHGFDALYTQKRHPVLVAVDRLFRKNIFERFYRTERMVSPLQDKRILDVGCGSGHYVVSFACSGAREVVGIDLSPAMLEMARGLAEAKGVAQRCRFVQGAFTQVPLEGSFHHSIAIGFFDYNRDVVAILKRMSKVTEGTVIATFPMLWAPRVPARKLWLTIKRCPVYFYTRREVERYFTAAGLHHISIAPCHGLYFAVGAVSSHKESQGEKYSDL